VNLFEKWRREVNIILNDTIGYSLKDMGENVENNVKKLFEDGEEPIEAAQYAAGEMDPSIDLDSLLSVRLMPKIKPEPKRNTKKFRNEDEI